MTDRKEVLEKFLNNSLLRQLTNLSEEQIEEVSFSTNSGDPLVEAVKKLIFSYSQGDAQVTIIKNVTLEIEKNS